MLEQPKEVLIPLHLELLKHHLVVWTGGNVSARDPETGLVAMKPSGVRYEQLRPEPMVVLDLEGRIVEGDLKASSDTSSPSLSTGIAPTLVAWSTPTPATPRWEDRSQWSSPPSLTSLAGRSRAAAFPSSGMSPLASWWSGALEALQPCC